LPLASYFAKWYYLFMNKKRLQTIRNGAKRTLLILELMEKGFSLQETAVYVEEAGYEVTRQVLEYYFKTLNK
jgi:hypothetical protein